MRARAMGKSTERATKESAPQTHRTSPFFKSGESRAAFFQPKLAAAQVQRQPKDQTGDVVAEGAAITYEQVKDQPGFEEWKEKQTAALKYKLWENQPTELKAGLIGFGLSSA